MSSVSLRGKYARVFCVRGTDFGKWCPFCWSSGSPCHLVCVCGIGVRPALSFGILNIYIFSLLNQWIGLTYTFIDFFFYESAPSFIGFLYCGSDSCFSDFSSDPFTSFLLPTPHLVCSSFCGFQRWKLQSLILDLSLFCIVIWSESHLSVQLSCISWALMCCVFILTQLKVFSDSPCAPGSDPLVI